MTPDSPHAPAWLTLLLAVSCGLVVANIYYVQPLAGPIAASLHMPPALAGVIVTMTQLGYGLGLFFVVPLGDLMENKRLIAGMTFLSGLALAGAALSASALPFLVSALLIGIASVAVQVMLPYTAHLADDATRGRVVGTVMSGLLFGIMLARPAASFIANFWSWHVVFGATAVLMIALAALLAAILPPRHPTTTLRYGELLRSLAHLMAAHSVLRRRSLYHSCLFAAFSIFWTVTPLLLASPGFGLNQMQIGVFALVGAAGALTAPIAGRLADRGHTTALTIGGMSSVAFAVAITFFAAPGHALALPLLVVAALVLDAGIVMNMVTSQRAIFALGAEVRSRVNGIYIACFFVASAAASAVGGWAYATAGWWLSSAIAIALPLLALGVFSTEHRKAQ